jgi:hypothetical protein
MKLAICDDEATFTGVLEERLYSLQEGLCESAPNIIYLPPIFCIAQRARKIAAYSAMLRKRHPKKF